MGYYDNKKIEDATIVNDYKDPSKSNDGLYSKEMIAKIESIRNKAKFSTLLERNKISVNMAIVSALVGTGYALYKRRNVVLFAALGGMAGLASANIFNKFFSLTVKDSSDDSKSSS